MTASTDGGLESPPVDVRLDRLEALYEVSPMYDAVIEETKGRQIRICDHWLADFASCNYVGFDLEPAIIDSVDREIRRWGPIPAGRGCSATPGCTSTSRTG